MDDLVTFLRARYDERERLALAASGRDRERPGEFAERWEWVHVGDSNPAYPGHALTDQPVDLARWANEVHIGDNSLDYAGLVSLRSAEEYPTNSVGSLPHFVIHQTEELEVSVARHIAENDPRYVLADVAAKRQILREHRVIDGRCHVCTAIAHDRARRFRAPCPTLRLLALPYAGHPDYDETWRP